MHRNIVFKKAIEIWEKIPNIIIIRKTKVFQLSANVFEGPVFIWDKSDFIEIEQKIYIMEDGMSWTLHYLNIK